jgi:hypothetical protein
MTSIHRALVVFGLAATAPLATGQICALYPDRDNTIYEPPQGSGTSNALFEGVVSGNAGIGLARRALMRFDVAGNVPAGVAITHAELILTVTNAPPETPERPFALHRLTADWGEGTSNTGAFGGVGAPATPGDATWETSFWPDVPWTTPGGDFAQTASAVAAVSPVVVERARWSSAQMIADVQGWLNDPATNHGWIVIGDEVNLFTARRFGSREHPIPEWRPVLVIGFAPPGTASFCDDSDGAHASCPCGNAGASGHGCDIQQLTGGVRLDVICQQTTPLNRATVRGSGFPPASLPSAVILRADALDSAAPIVFGDGLRCIGTPLVRFAGTIASGGISLHGFGHGAMAGAGTKYYQLWFRNQPASYCTPDAFNLSNGHTLIW